MYIYNIICIHVYIYIYIYIYCTRYTKHKAPLVNGRILFSKAPISGAKSECFKRDAF